MRGRNEWVWISANAAPTCTFCCNFRGMTAAVEGHRVMRAPEFMAAVGLTYRQLDYWCRMGVLEPAQAAHGSGSQRLFDVREVHVGVVLAHLRAFGAELDVLRRVGSQLRIDQSYLLPGALYIDPEGWVSHAPGPVCWRLDLATIAPLVDVPV